MNVQPGIDRSGNIIERGDRVRLLAIRPSILARLGISELADVSSMLGQVLEVFDVYEDGLVWVSLAWPRADGTTEVHAVAVDPPAIELVSKATNVLRS